MKKYIKDFWVDMLFSFLMTLIAAIIISLLFGYSFSTNDDAMLRNLASGNYTGSPESHLIYIMYPLGLLWKSLYSLIPSVPWYDIFMVGMHYVCWFMIILRIMQQYQHRIKKICASVLGMCALFIIDLPYLVMHQYTVLAALLAGVAILWLATMEEYKGKRFVVDRIVCIVFLTFCLWLRNEVLFMALPIGMFVLLKEICNLKKEGNTNVDIVKKTGVFVGIFAVITVLSFTVENIAYNSDEWQDYKIYNDARTEIYDFYGIPSYDNYKDEYEALGISYADWLAIDHYDSGLVDSLNAEKLEEIATWAKADRKEAQQYYSVTRQGVYAVIDTIFYNSVQPIGIVLCVLYVVALLCMYVRKDKMHMLCLCGMLLYQFLFVGYFLLQGRFPERVSYGLYFMQAIYIVSILFRGKKAELNTWKPDKFCLGVGCVVCIFVLGTVGLYQIRMTLNECNIIEQKADDWNYVNSYFNQNAENRYCIVTKSFVFSTERMFSKARGESDNVVRLGTWVQNSPLEYERNAGIGINNLGEQLITDSNIYIVQDVENDFMWIDSLLDERATGMQTRIVDTICTPGGRQFYVIAVQ